MLNLNYVGTPEGLMEYLAEQVGCWICMDTGEVTQAVPVYPGEPHMMQETVPCPHLRNNG